MHTLKPRLSEKAFMLSQKTNTFVIDVPSDLNKYEVASAVSKQFNVEIKSIRLVNRKGKTKRIMNLTGKRTVNSTGTQSRIKKAYITLRPGSHLPFFAAAEEEIAKAETKKAKESKPSEKSTSSDTKKTTVLKKLVGKKEAK